MADPEVQCLENLFPKFLITRSWEESKDPYLNRILSEEWYAARVPARRDIHLMVPENDDTKAKWWELPVNVRFCPVDGSAEIEFRFKPSANTYDAARVFIRNSLYLIEADKDLLNFLKTTDYFVNMIPYLFLFEVGKMKITELHKYFKANKNEPKLK